MDNILISLLNPSNRYILAAIVILSSLRILLEITPLNLSNLPISRALSEKYGRARMSRIHKVGLKICIFQVILWGPELLFYS